MKKALFFCLILIGGISLFRPSFDGSRSWAQGSDENKDQRSPEGSQGDASRKNILVEIFLAPEHKGDVERIRREFEVLSITRFRSQVFRLGNPPENIAIGKDIPAPVARLAIRLAITYNRGVKYLLPEYRFFPDHIAIGTSAFDEKSQIPIRPEDLKRLSDPGLTTDQFHELYRHLTGEDVRLPKYTD